MDERQRKAYWASRNRPFLKGFLHDDGSIEEVEDYDPYYTAGRSRPRLRGYGVGYSHPRHLNEGWGENIKSFKDMDRVLDQREIMRLNDDEKFRTINIGNTATPEQLAQIKSQFETHDSPVRAKITSNSRKYYKTYPEFHRAFIEHVERETPDIGNKDFESHIKGLSQN